MMPRTGVGGRYKFLRNAPWTTDCFVKFDTIFQHLIFLSRFQKNLLNSHFKIGSLDQYLWIDTNIQIKVYIVIKLLTAKTQGVCVGVSKKERDSHTDITCSF